jgi:hypothetical protein
MGDSQEGECGENSHSSLSAAIASLALWGMAQARLGWTLDEGKASMARRTRAKPTFPAYKFQVDTITVHVNLELVLLKGVDWLGRKVESQE